MGLLKRGCAVAISGLTLFAASTAGAATPAQVTSVNHAVNNLDQTVHFYHDVLGLRVLWESHIATPDPAYSALTGTWGARYREAVIEVPNEPFTLNLIQYNGVPRSQVNEQAVDPGSLQITYSIKDAATTFARLIAANAPQALPGLPTSTNPPPPDQLSTAWVRDPDGSILETVHRRPGAADWFTVPPPAITDAPGMSQIIRGQLDFTTGSVGEASALGTLLGFDLIAGYPQIGIGPGLVPDGFFGALFGVAPTDLFSATTGNCAPTVRCEFFYYDSPGLTPVAPRPQDAGAAMLQVSTGDVFSLVAKLRANGFTVVTPGRHPVIVRGRLSILLRSPSGLLMRFDQQLFELRHGHHRRGHRR